MSNLHKAPRILTFREFVPDWSRFWILILITLVFLFSGAIQLASVTQQVGLFGYKDEDAKMIGYCAFVGMNMIFPILFPIRFRFSTKTILLTVTIVLFFCHLFSLFTTNVFFLCIINFIAGTFRMLGAFETMVCAQLTITPTRNYATFYSSIFFIVQGSALLFGGIVLYLMEYFNWFSIQQLIILLLVWVFLTVMILFRHYYSMKKIPLYGIDWTGYILWTISLLLLLFIITYGKYYEWFNSIHIRIATLLFFSILIFNIYHMFQVKRAYINIETWKYKNLWKLVAMFIALYIALATTSSLQNFYMSNILHFDGIHLAYLNWIVLAGMAISALLCYIWFVKYNRNIKPMIFIGFGAIAIYLWMTYKGISLYTPFESFYIPSFLRGFGLLLLYIVLTLYVANIVPFKHNFQVLCIIGFIRMSLGTALGSSIITNWMQFLSQKNRIILGTELDPINSSLFEFNFNKIYTELETQIFLLSMKEIYGWILFASLIILTIILLEREFRFYNLFHPKMRTIRKIFKKEIL